MGHMSVKANECEYKERKLKEQFINGINDYMMVEIKKELNMMEEINYIMNEMVLCWAKRVEAQKCKK